MRFERTRKTPPDVVRNIALGAGLGVLLAFYLDPQSGKRRRHGTRDRVLAVFRGGGRKTAKAGRAVAAEAYGVTQKALHLREQPNEYDDVTLARKVETEIFRDADVPKGKINVNAENGKVVLRGEVDSPELIDELVEKARKVQGVRDIENLLQLSRAPARTGT